MVSVYYATPVVIASLFLLIFAERIANIGKNLGLPAPLFLLLIVLPFRLHFIVFDLFFWSRIESHLIEPLACYLDAQAFKAGGLPHIDVQCNYGPLFIILCLGPVLLWNDPRSIKFALILIDLLTLYIVYLLGKRLFKNDGLYPALLYGLSSIPLSIVYAIGYHEPLNVLFMILGVYLYLSDKKGLAMVVLGIGATYKWFPLPLALFLILREDKLNAIKYFLTAVLTFILCNVPLVAISGSHFLASYAHHIERGGGGFPIYQVLRIFGISFGPLVPVVIQGIATLIYLLFAWKTRLEPLKASLGYIIVTLLTMKSLEIWYFLILLPFLSLVVARGTGKKDFVAFLLLNTIIWQKHANPIPAFLLSAGILGYYFVRYAICLENFDAPLNT